MRIIGDNSQKFEREVTCRNCGAGIAYMPIDVTAEKRADYTGSTDTYGVIVCPKCKEKITIGLW